jgi:hypothetical protein
MILMRKPDNRIILINSGFIQKQFKEHPILAKKAEFFILAFPTSYLCEIGFSRVLLLLTKQRNHVIDC